MKIAALGDIHGNYQALITVLEDLKAWQPDLVLVLGDIINRGPRSRDCLELVREQAANPAWYLIRGNHEDYVLDFEDPGFAGEGIDFDLKQVIHWTYKSLARPALDDLIDLPAEIKIDLPGMGLVQGAHASTAGDRIGIYPSTPEGKLKGLIPEDARLFLVGHTHQPLVRTFKNTLIINTGSVGLPFDGDTRAAYAQIIYRHGAWQGEIIRIAYDLKAAEDDFYQSGYIPEGGPLAELILAELQLGWPQLGKWFKAYEKAVREKSIGLKEAVYEFLKNPNIEYRNPHPPR